MDLHCGRIRDDSGLKSTRGYERNALLRKHFCCVRRAFCAAWVLNTVSRGLKTAGRRSSSASPRGSALLWSWIAVKENHLHVLVRLEPDVSNGWSAEDVVRRWLAANESSRQPISTRDWLGSKRSIGPKPSCRRAPGNVWPGKPPR
jgi:hypothetical protein